MPTIEVGENTYGWGPDVAPLPTDPMAAGPKLIDTDEARALEDEVERMGWTAGGDDAEEVFLVAPKAWKRPVALYWDHSVKIRVVEAPDAAYLEGDRRIGDNAPPDPPAEPGDAGEDAANEKDPVA